MIYIIKYKKIESREQTFTLNVDFRKMEPKVSAHGEYYFTLWVAERQAFRSLRCDRIVALEIVEYPSDIKSALAKARKAYSNYKRTRG